MARKSYRALACIALTAPLLATSAASAHPGHSRSERLVRLSLADEPPQIGYGLVLSLLDSIAERKRADRDGDGTVTPVEEKAAVAGETAALLQTLTICRGPSAAELRCDRLTEAHILETTTAGWNTTNGPTLALSWTLSLDLGEADGAVKLVDTWARGDVDRSDGAIEPHPKHPLSAAGPGDSLDSDAAVTTAFTWSASAETRVLHASWGAPPARWPLVAVACAAGAALVVQVIHRRRARPGLE